MDYRRIVLARDTDGKKHIKEKANLETKLTKDYTKIIGEVRVDYERKISNLKRRIVKLKSKISDLQIIVKPKMPKLRLMRTTRQVKRLFFEKYIKKEEK